MTPEEIRTLDTDKNGYAKGWKGAPFYIGSVGAIPLILIEIAAQLAELNKSLRKAQ